MNTRKQGPHAGDFIEMKNSYKLLPDFKDFRQVFLLVGSRCAANQYLVEKKIANLLSVRILTTFCKLRIRQDCISSWTTGVHLPPSKFQ